MAQILYMYHYCKQIDLLHDFNSLYLLNIDFLMLYNLAFILYF